MGVAQESDLITKGQKWFKLSQAHSNTNKINLAEQVDSISLSGRQFLPCVEEAPNGIF